MNAAFATVVKGDNTLMGFLFEALEKKKSPKQICSFCALCIWVVARQNGGLGDSLRCGKSSK